MGSIIVSVRHSAKSLEGFAAVAGVNLDIRRDTIHALIGPMLRAGIVGVLTGWSGNHYC